MNKEKQHDMALWKQMGMELRVLDCLIGSIRTDNDYNDMMDRRTWGRLNRMLAQLSELKSECEDRMFRLAPSADTGIFYGNIRTNDRIEELVQQMREEMKS